MPIETHFPDRHAEIDVALEAWARWAKSALSGLGWPPLTLLAKIIAHTATGAAREAGAHIEADEFCELIDRLVMKLPEIERKVIVRHYLHWEPQQVSARHLSMSYPRFRLVLHRARRSLAYRLEGAALVLQQER